MAFDEISLKKLSYLYPDIKTRAIRFEQDIKKALNLQLKITEGLRSFKRQTELYLKGRALIKGEFQITDRKQIVTNAMPGESVHHYGFAIDIAFQGPDPYLSNLSKKDFDYTWRRTGEIGQINGFKWGFDWNGNGIVDSNDFDRPHFELTYGERVHNLRELYAHQKLASCWARADQLRGVPVAQDWNDLTVKMALTSLE